MRYGLLEEILDVVFVDDALLEGIVSRVALDHFDHLGHGNTTFFLQGRYYFLCHGSVCLFDLFVNRHSLQDGVVFLQLHAIRCILFVLGGDIS